MNQSQGQGMSRAAKKKRRKKQNVLHRAQKLLKMEQTAANDTENSRIDDIRVVDSNDDHQQETNILSVSVTQTRTDNQENFELQSFKSLFERISQTSEFIDYAEISSKLFQCVISPSNLTNEFSTDDFYLNYWGKTLYHCNRKKKNHFKGLLTKETFKTLLTSHFFYLKKDIVVNNKAFISTKKPVQHASLKSASENEPEFVEANVSEIWRGYEDGLLSVCFKSAAQYDDKIWQFLSLLESELESVVQCHASLLPYNGRFL